MTRLFPVTQPATIDDTLQADLDAAIEARDRLLIGWRTNRHLDHWKAAYQLAVLDRWIEFLLGRVAPLTERGMNAEPSSARRSVERPSGAAPAARSASLPRSVSGSIPLLLGIAPNPFEETNER